MKIRLYFKMHIKYTSIAVQQHIILKF